MYLKIRTLPSKVIKLIRLAHKYTGLLLCILIQIYLYMHNLLGLNKWSYFGEFIMHNSMVLGFFSSSWPMTLRPRLPKLIIVLIMHTTGLLFENLKKISLKNLSIYLHFLFFNTNIIHVTLEFVLTLQPDCTS